MLDLWAGFILYGIKPLQILFMTHAYEACAKLFADPTEEALPGWIFKRWCWEDLRRFRAITGSFLKEIILGMPPGKTCSDDYLVVEMLQQLDDDILDVLAGAFKFRLLNHLSEDNENAWDTQVLNLLKKKIRVEFINDFRPIAILPVLV